MNCNYIASPIFIKVMRAKLIDFSLLEIVH